MAVNRALEQGVTHCMFVDNDIVFPANGIRSLLEKDKDIIGANYNQRQFPLQSTVKVKDNEGNFVSLPMPDTANPFEVWSLGLGFSLVKREVFEKVPKPWFANPIDEKDVFITDDVFFFSKCQEAGFKVWCDPLLVVKHIGDYLY